MELVLEQTQQGTSYEVSVSAEGVEELKRKVKIKGEKKEALKHQSDTKVIHNDDGNPSRANIKQALAGNPVKEILLKLNLPDHRSILTDSKEYIKMDVEVPGSSSLIRFIATCSYSTDIYKDIMKAQLKNIKKDGYTRFQHQEQYEHVGLEVTRSQEGKRSQDDDKRLCLVDDLKEVLNHIHIKYSTEIRYHPGKANVVADALSRKEKIKPRRAQAMNMTIESSIKSKILAAQNEASEVVNAPAKMLQGLDE
ncbi:hypothetical protein Tco_0371080 [Tanacetum coccineum]